MIGSIAAGVLATLTGMLVGSVLYRLGVIQGRKQATASLLWLFSQSQAAKLATPALPPSPAPADGEEVKFQ